MKLNIDIIDSSFFYALNRISLRLFEVISLWILIKLLPATEIALIGISVGFIALLNILNISPERIIYKSYEEVQKRLSDHVSSYMAFWFFKSAGMLLIALIVAAIYARSGYGGEMFLVMSGLTITYLFGNLQLLMQEVFFVSLRQKSATYFNLASMAIFLLSMGLLVIYPSAELYVGLVLLKSALTALGFIALAGKEIGFALKVPSDAIALVKDALAEFAVLDHLIGAGIEIVSKSFLFVLGFFAAHQVVGNYTIALSLVNFLIFGPMVLYRTSMLAITRVTTKDGLEKVLSAFTKYSVLLSLIQLGLFMIFLEHIVRFFAGTLERDIWVYAALLGFGTSVFTAGYPVHAVAILKTDIRKYFLRVILPVTAASVLGYVAASALLEPVLVGVIFVIAAVAINVLAYLHVKKASGVSIRGAAFYPEEKEALGYMLRKLGM